MDDFDTQLSTSEESLRLCIFLLVLSIASVDVEQYTLVSYGLYMRKQMH